jgi:hypothetical protein
MLFVFFKKELFFFSFLRLLLLQRVGLMFLHFHGGFDGRRACFDNRRF